MKMSLNFVKTSKDVPSDETSNNARLLIRAGYIHKTMAGVYSYLPLGLRTLNKIENIVRKHIDSIGGQEVLMSSLSPKENWEKTGRWKEISEYFCLPSQSGIEYRLNPTHEEVISPIAANYVKSYKDLPQFDPERGVYPMAIYQIQNKFRDELRSKAGLMRGREFKMKDMYDFHRTKESQEAYFELITKTYHKIFEEIGLKSYSVNASGGVFSEKMSREFQALCNAGEDWVYLDEKTGQAFNQEVAPSLAPEFDYTGEEEKPREDILLEGVIGVEALYKKLGIEITKTTKTLFYEDKDGKLIVAAVRGDRSVSEEKLQKLYGKSLKMATSETVKKHTGAEIGYAGIINLPQNCITYFDNSISKLKNFETGTNKTGYHSINVCFGRDLKTPEKFYDIKEAVEGDTNPQSGNVYQIHRGAEVGNIFDLGQKWVKAFNISYMDENNKPQYPYMGCHGIGTSRCMGVAAEVYSDEKGLKLPESIAPYKVHLITLIGKKDDETTRNRIMELSRSVYEAVAKLEGVPIEKGEVLWDDRENASMGEKLKDADLIGCPYQIIVSGRSIEELGGFEIRKR
jgi:prolyl-tRNA synthetase